MVSQTGITTICLAALHPLCCIGSGQQMAARGMGNPLQPDIQPGMVHQHKHHHVAGHGLLESRRRLSLAGETRVQLHGAVALQPLAQRRLGDDRVLGFGRQRKLA